MHTQHIARIGVAVALLAVAAWITIPFGPVPFTLQTLALALLPAALPGFSALAAVVLYVLLGAIGLPIFAGFGAGIGTLAGPTGGFLWGFILGMALACALARALSRTLPRFASLLIADAALLLVSYGCGTVQLMAIGAMGLVPALMVAVVPFVIPDIVKIVVGARIGIAVSRATAPHAHAA